MEWGRTEMAASIYLMPLLVDICAGRDHTFSLITSRRSERLVSRLFPSLKGKADPMHYVDDFKRILEISRIYLKGWRG